MREKQKKKKSSNMRAYPVVCFLFSTKGSLMWHKRDNNIGNKIFTVINRACFLLITHHVCLAARSQSFFARFKLVAAIFLQDFLTCISPLLSMSVCICMSIFLFVPVFSCTLGYFLELFHYLWR